MNVFLESMHHMFVGKGIDFLLLAEIIFRTVFMFVYTIINVRLMDKRSLGMLSPFEIIIIIALGSAVGDPMFYRDIPLLHGMIVVSCVVFIERVVAKLSVKSRLFERFISGRPVLIIREGKLLKENMARENFSVSELYSILRLRGVRRIGDVELAYLEPSGSISIIKKEAARESDILPNGPYQKPI